MRFFPILILFVLLTNAPILQAQAVFEDVELICGNQAIATGVPIQTEFDSIALPCGSLPGAPNFLTPYLDFYQVIIQSGTTFTFTVTPDSPVDYDFACWLNPDLGNLGVASRVSQNDPVASGGLYSIGLSLTDTYSCEFPGSAEDGFVRYYEVQPGDMIVIAIDRFQETDSGYTIGFGGDAILSCALSYHSCDTDQDGNASFDLTEIAQNIQQTNFPDYEVTFYSTFQYAEDENDLGLLTGEYIANDNTTTIVYARLETPAGDFLKIVEVSFTVFPIPAVNPPPPLFYCTSSGSTIGLFNLPEAVDDIIGDPTGLTISYYTTLAAAQNGGSSGLISYPASYFGPAGTVYARFENQFTCFNTQQIDLVVSQMNLQPQNLDVPMLCLGTEENTIDLTLFNEQLTNSDFQSYVYEYYLSENDAQTGNSANVIMGPETFAVLPGTTVTIYVRIKMGTNCSPIVSSLQLSVVGAPTLTTAAANIEICHGTATTLHVSTDGVSGNWYDTQAAQAPIYNGLSFPTPPLTQNTSYWVEAVSENGCVSARLEIDISVVDLVDPVFDLDADLSYCLDDEAVALPLTSSNGVTGSWSPAMIDTSIQGTDSYIFTPDPNQCANSFALNATVFITPELEMEDQLEICPGQPYEFSAPAGFDSYTWRNAQGNIVSTTQEIVFSQMATYSLAALVSGSPCSFSAQIEVTFAEVPVITEVEAGLNTIRIYTQSPNVVSYSLDQIAWQDSPIFTDVEPGKYKVYVRNSIGCISAAVQADVLGVPKLLTPNGDGYHDTWVIPSIAGYPEAAVHIFDRFGKLIYSNTIGSFFSWDGQYNGRPMPSSTYWYAIDLAPGLRLTGPILLKR